MRTYYKEAIHLPYFDHLKSKNIQYSISNIDKSTDWRCRSSNPSTQLSLSVGWLLLHPSRGQRANTYSATEYEPSVPKCRGYDHGCSWGNLVFWPGRSRRITSPEDIWCSPRIKPFLNVQEWHAKRRSMCRWFLLILKASKASHTMYGPVDPMQVGRRWGRFCLIARGSRASLYTLGRWQKADNDADDDL